MEIHCIVDVVEGLFIEKMSDGSVALTKMGEIIRDFVIGALKQAKDVLEILVHIIGDFAEQGHSMTGILRAATVPLKLVAKLAASMGAGFFEAIIAYKILNGIIPINSLVIANNIKSMMGKNAAQVASNQLDLIQVHNGKKLIQLQVVEGKARHLNGNALKTEILQKNSKIVVDNMETGGIQKKTVAMGALMRAQVMSKMIMFGAMLLTQKIAKDSWVLAGIIGALAGAYMGYAIALQMAAAAQLELTAGGFLGGSQVWRAMAFGAAAGAAFNILLQQMMAPDMSNMPTPVTMDTGGRFLSRRKMYDTGGYTQEHGMAMLQSGETVIPKTQNMLGQGITINMGDVYANDGTDFADKLADELPIALQRVSDRGGI
jgi:hypothetical protein